MPATIREWTRAASKRGVQNTLVDLIETLDRNRSQLAELSSRYVAWRGKTTTAVAATSRRERIRKVEELLAEAERLNPGGTELAALRRRLEAVKSGAP